MPFLICLWLTDWDCDLQFRTSVLCVSNEILPQPGSVLLPWTLLVFLAIGLGSLLQKGIKILASGPVLDGFSQGAHHLAHSGSCGSREQSSLKGLSFSHSLPPFSSVTSRWFRRFHVWAIYRQTFNSAFSTGLCLNSDVRNLENVFITEPLRVPLRKYVTQQSPLTVCKRTDFLSFLMPLSWRIASHSCF